MTRDGRHRCFTGRFFRATDCRNAAGQAPDRAELKQRDGWDGIAPISRVESSLGLG